MDYLRKIPSEVQWDDGEQLYPGIVDRVFDQKKIGAPYIFDSDQTGYCGICYFWLASQPDEDFFKKLISVKHQLGSITWSMCHIIKPPQNIYEIESPTIYQEAQLAKYENIPSHIISRSFCSFLVSEGRKTTTSIVKTVYSLIAQPGKYIVFLFCQNKHFKKEYHHKVHSFAVYHDFDQETGKRIVKLFDWRLGCYQFTEQPIYKLHKILSCLSNYYMGISESTYIMTIQRFRITEAMQHSFFLHYKNLTDRYPNKEDNFEFESE